MGSIDGRGVVLLNLILLFFCLYLFVGRVAVKVARCCAGIMLLNHSLSRLAVNSLL